MADPKKPTAYGNAFRNKQYQPGHPEFRGDVTVPVELLRILVAKIKEGKEAKLSIAMWPKESPRAGRYFSVSLVEHVEWKKQQGGKPDELNDEIPF